MTMIKKWACGHCKTIYEGESEAEECCPPEEVWECDRCGDWVESEQDDCNNCNQ